MSEDNEYPTSFTFQGANSEALIRLHSDGRVEVSDKVSTDDLGKLFIESMRVNFAGLIQSARSAALEEAATIATEQAHAADEKMKAALSKGGQDVEGFRGMGMAAFAIAAAIRALKGET